MDRFDLTSGSYISDTVLIVLSIATLVGAATVPLIRWRRRRRSALLIREWITRVTQEDLTAHSTELAGTVEVEDGDVAACSIRVVQSQHIVARETSDRFSSSWVEWKEERRIVALRPFTLVLNGTGTRVRVDTDESVHLVARAYLISTTGSTTMKERTLEARLTHGERVAIAGKLEHLGGENDEVSSSKRRNFSLHAAVGARLRIVAASAAEAYDDFYLPTFKNYRSFSAIAALGCLSVLTLWAYRQYTSVAVIADVVRVSECGPSKSPSTRLCVDTAYISRSGSLPTTIERCHGPLDAASSSFRRPVAGDRVHVTEASVFGEVKSCRIGEAVHLNLFETLGLLLFGGFSGVFSVVQILGLRSETWWNKREPFDF